MSQNETLDPAIIESVAHNIFYVLPLLRKKLLYLDTVQAEHGIPLSHTQVLSMLSEVGSMSVSEISRKLGIAKPNITPLVDRLIDDGYVDRIRDTTDRRVVNIIILDAGRAKLEAIKKSVSDLVHSWSKQLSMEDYKELCNSLISLSRILTEMNGR